MASGIQLLVVEGSKTLDVTELVEKIVWKGRFGSAARSIKVTLIDDSGYQRSRSGIDVTEGHQCCFYYDGDELFRGIIMTQTQTQKKKMTFTAYDNGIYLSNNKDTYTYTNKTADAVFKDVCSRLGMPTDEVASCTYKIPELTKSKTTAFDVIADALSLDYDATGIRHYIFSEKGKLSLRIRRQTVRQWVIETGQNLSEYSYTRSIEDVRTRIKMVSSEGTTIASKANTSLEAKIGVMQDIQTPDENLTTAQINDLISSVLQTKSTPERSVEVTAMGLPDVISGIGVYMIISDLDIKETFYVDEDTHTFEGNSHTMTLKLLRAADIDIETSSSSSASSSSSSSSIVDSLSKGDTVQFLGGYHYYTSQSTSPTGGYINAGPARVYNIAKGAKHPISLIGASYYSDMSGSCAVYGWVDEDLVSK